MSGKAKGVRRPREGLLGDMDEADFHMAREAREGVRLTVQCAKKEVESSAKEEKRASDRVQDFKVEIERETSALEPLEHAYHKLNVEWNTAELRRDQFRTEYKAKVVRVRTCMEEEELLCTQSSCLQLQIDIQNTHLAAVQPDGTEFAAIRESIKELEDKAEDIKGSVANVKMQLDAALTAQSTAWGDLEIAEQEVKSVHDKTVSAFVPVKQKRARREYLIAEMKKAEETLLVKKSLLLAATATLKSKCAELAASDSHVRYCVLRASYHNV